jgi:transcriptional regulator with XRE-family HTH domain
MSCRDSPTSVLVIAAVMINVELFVRLRGDKKLSQNDLAKAIGASQQLIGEIEAGRVRSTKAIYKIARALGTTAGLLDPEIPAGESGWAKIQQELAELDPEDAAYLLERFANDIEFTKRAKRSK